MPRRGNYPARGDLRFANGTLQFTDTFVQVAGGTVSGEGILANRQWSADLTARGVQLNQLAAGVPGELTANAQLAGSLDNPSLAGIQGRGYRHRCPGRGQSGGPGQPRRGQLDR